MKIKRVLLMVLVFILSVTLPSYVKAAQPQKRVIQIGGVPAEWLGKRISGNLVVEVIQKKTPYGANIVGGLGLISAERFGALMDGKIDLTIDITGIDMLLKLLPVIDPALGGRFKYLAVFPETLQPIPLIVYKDLPVNSLREVIDKKYPLKIAVGRIGSKDLMDVIWKAMGVPNGVEEIEKWGGKVEKSTTPAQVSPMLREGILNAYMNMGENWDPGLEEVNRVKPLKVLPVAQDEKDLAAIKKVTRSLDRYIMKAGHYSFATTDTPILGNIRFYVGSPKLSNEEAYTLARAIWEERDSINKASQDFRSGLTPEAVRAATKLGTIPFHPGAERYFREVGLW